MADMALKMDATNRQLAAGLMEHFTQWRKYGEPFRGKMHAQLLRLQGEKLSVNAAEVVSKSLQ